MSEKPPADTEESVAEDVESSENLGRRMTPEEIEELGGDMNEYIAGLEAWLEEEREKLSVARESGVVSEVINAELEVLGLETEIADLKLFVEASQEEGQELSIKPLGEKE